MTAPSPVLDRIFELVNLSKIDSNSMVNCYNFALTKVALIQSDVLRVIYPMGEFFGDEINNNDKHYRDPTFVPSVEN